MKNLIIFFKDIVIDLLTFYIKLEHPPYLYVLKLLIIQLIKWVINITIKNNVEKLLSEDKKCRNDDMYLNLKYWQKFNNLNVDLSIFDKLTSSETIRRSRQNLQNDEDKFPPTDPIVRAYREKNRGKPYK